ncbi:MAG: ChbG/HpnK family deacetylase [Castellaniella sp.]
MCADDFGMNRAINAGVLALAHQGRLSGTSVLVDGPALDDHDLDALSRAGLQLGLHLNFTEALGQTGVCMPLGAFIRAALLRQLPVDRLRAGVQAQWQRFEALFGRAPDYIDGHQHVHQLPVVRDVLLQGLPRGVSGRPWIRDTGRPRTAGLPLRSRTKAWVIAVLGATGLRHRARSLGYRQNPGFLGVYDFKGGVSAYQRCMAAWLAQARDGDVLMCHPALGAQPDDPLSAQRQAEYQVLAGVHMQHWLDTHHLMIDRAESRIPEHLHEP